MVFIISENANKEPHIYVFFFILKCRNVMNSNGHF